MEENTSTFPQRPTFLTVLCILTFIGSGYGIFQGITSYATAETAAAASELIEESM
ncbi:hypothetical protein N9I68_01420 [Bacteroidia bacterium]|nr:hypothetical protein [Bacteroidia bacterium]MDB4107410.1 hypothetical protein [Bacteroidia bacterium]